MQVHGSGNPPTSFGNICSQPWFFGSLQVDFWVGGGVLLVSAKSILRGPVDAVKVHWLWEGQRYCSLLCYRVVTKGLCQMHSKEKSRPAFQHANLTGTFMPLIHCWSTIYDVLGRTFKPTKKKTCAGRDPGSDAHSLLTRSSSEGCSSQHLHVLQKKHLYHLPYLKLLAPTNVASFFVPLSLLFSFHEECNFILHSWKAAVTLKWNVAR